MIRGMGRHIEDMQRTIDLLRKEVQDMPCPAERVKKVEGKILHLLHVLVEHRHLHRHVHEHVYHRAPPPLSFLLTLHSFIPVSGGLLMGMLDPRLPTPRK